MTYFTDEFVDHELNLEQLEEVNGSGALLGLGIVVVIGGIIYVLAKGAKKVAGKAACDVGDKVTENLDKTDGKGKLSFHEWNKETDLIV
tara:strand:- start:566 stop:832 length:267 start_codon:yes stop_codon:yes gene_type:complete